MDTAELFAWLPPFEACIEFDQKPMAYQARNFASMPVGTCKENEPKHGCIHIIKGLMHDYN
jgi:hypothetical protein